MKIGKILLLVFGSIATLVALALLAIGGVLLWAHTTQRDEDGFFTSRTVRFDTATRAVTSEEIDLGTDTEGPDWVEGLATVRIRATSSEPEKEIFLGIATEQDVEDYLASVEHAEVVDIDDDPVSVEYRIQDGDAPPAPAAEQAFWDASTQGFGTQTIEWEIEGGSWAVVVMNSDGSPGVSVDASVGAKVGFLLWLAIGLLAGGAVLLGGGVTMIAFGARGWGVPEPAAAPTSALGAAPADAGSRPYPVRLDGVLDPSLSRWLWLVKWLLAIPHYIVLFFLWIAFLVLTVAAGFAILFTARYPRGIFDFNLGVLRWTWRVFFYSYRALGTDRYPPFSLGPEPDYPATLDVEYQERLSRGLVLVKWWLLAIPHYIVVGIFQGGWGFGWGWADSGWSGSGAGLIVILVLFAAVCLLFTRRYPRDIFDLVLGMNRWSYRVLAYAALMRDEYPPFRLAP
jgi:hypothetical protein